MEPCECDIVLRIDPDLESRNSTVSAVTPQRIMSVFLFELCGLFDHASPAQGIMLVQDHTLESG